MFKEINGLTLLRKKIKPEWKKKHIDKSKNQSNSRTKIQVAIKVNFKKWIGQKTSNTCQNYQFWIK